MIKTEERLLKDRKQIKSLEELGFEFERCGYALCKFEKNEKLRKKEKPSFKRVDIYKWKKNSMLPVLRLYITRFKRRFYIVINDEESQAKYHSELETSKAQIIPLVNEYLKEHKYPYNTQNMVDIVC